MKICTNCQFFLNKGDEGLIWYNLYCKATSREKEPNPVTGIAEYVGHNDLGNKYYTDEQYKNCREVNANGDCKLFADEFDGSGDRQKVDNILRLVSDNSNRDS